MCVTTLLCGPRADLWPFYGLLCKRFSLSAEDIVDDFAASGNRRIELLF